MNLAFRILKSYFPELNERFYDELDFWFFCDDRGIDASERKMKKKGYYVADESGDYIFIDSRLRSPRKLEVIFHELTHALLHFPTPELKSRQQFEAQALALIFLIPQKALFDYSWLEENPTRYAFKLFRERQRLYFLYQL